MADKSLKNYEVSKESAVAVASTRMFHWLNDLHKASLVGLVRVGLVDKHSAKVIANGIISTIETHDAPDIAPSLDYLDFEKRMTKIIGPTASLLHIGRSRQDIRSTSTKFYTREIVRETIDAIASIRHNLLQVAAQHVHTVIPAYTHGVPAQPTTLAHYLLAFNDTFERHAMRLEETYSRLNKCPLGAEVNSTSRFKLDRHLLAELLGFDGIIENAYDANHGASVDSLLEVGQVWTLIAVQTSEFIQDLHTLHMTSRPWIELCPGPLMGISSAMPQKRNPRALEYVRELGGLVIGQTQAFLYIGRNMNTGMIDVRETALRMPEQIMLQMLSLTADIIPSLRINIERARQEASADYSTMINVADTLYEKEKVPFRTGHHFASLLTDYGRENDLFPLDIPYTEARRIFKSIDGEDLPVTESEMKEALDPVSYVATRQGTGGPQESEVNRMLKERQERLKKDVAHSNARKNKIIDALQCCDVEFRKMM